MCGLYGGISNTLSQFERERVKQLAIMSQLRGLDSGGFFTTYRNRGDICVGMHKDAVSTSEVIISKKGTDLLDADNVFIIAGHSRAATIGRVTQANAHPFHINHIVGMHNGTVPQLSGKDGKTDSEQLYTIMAEEGLQQAVNAARHGAYALVWLDAEKKTLNFLRNRERPLVFLRMGTTSYWSSEAGMLHLLRTRDNISSGDILGLAENKHMSICLLTNKINQRTVVPEDPKTIIITPRDVSAIKPPTVTSVPSVPPVKKGITDYFEDGSYQRKLEELHGIPFEPDKPTTLVHNQTMVDHLNHKLPMFQAFRRKRMDMARALSLLGEGCSTCTDICDHNDDTFWFNNDSYICHKCKGTEYAKTLVDHTKLFKGEVINQ